MQILAIVAICALGVTGLLGANLLRDRSVDASVSRHLAGLFGGVAYLISVLYLEPWLTTGMSASIALLIFTLRLRFKRQLRGLSQPDAAHRWGELAYMLAATASLAIGWGMLGSRWLGFLPIAFMAWGDSAAGLLRAWISSTRQLSACPSIAMLGVCLIAAALFQPYWISAVGAGVATAAERYRPTTSPLWEDNWTIVATSLAAMGGLAAFRG